MINLSGKKILFIGSGFFDYDESITEKLKSYGADIYYFSSALTNFKKRIFIRLGKIEKARAVVSGKLLALIEQQPNEVDYIFIIKADNFQKEHVELLKKKYPHIPIVLYLWDSIKWLNNRELLLSCFDRIFTFDRMDAEQYHLNFRPLFYRISTEQSEDKPKYDISFVGSWHTERYEFLRKILPQLKNNGIRYRFILRGGRFSIFIDKYITKRIKKEDANIFVTKPIPYSDYVKLCMNSRVVLDVANPMQTGLTIRTIEVLGMGRKLLTTNRDICNYSIDKRLYSVIDITNPVVDIDFIKNETVIETNISNLSLDSFLEEIFKGF